MRERLLALALTVAILAVVIGGWHLYVDVADVSRSSRFRRFGAGRADRVEPDEAIAPGRCFAPQPEAGH